MDERRRNAPNYAALTAYALALGGPYDAAAVPGPPDAGPDNPDPDRDRWRRHRPDNPGIVRTSPIPTQRRRDRDRVRVG